MKINIDKLQTGGRMFFSAVADPSSIYNQLQQAASTSSNTASSTSDGLLSKETMNKLNSGLPNEVAYLNNIIAELETKIDLGYPINRQELADLRSLANRVISQADYLQKAEEFAKENLSRDDIAIDQNGFIYAFDSKGKMKKISFKDYDASKYQAVTIGELIEYRRNDPAAINNSDIIKTIGNSIGLEKINDFILKILKDIGNTSTKEDAYESLRMALGKDTKQLSNADYAAIKALAQASDLIGLDLLFKISTTTSNSNVALAAQYLISILPKNMKMQLLGTAIALGMDKTSAANYAAGLIQMASLASNKSTFNYDVTPNDGKDGSSSGTAKTQTRNITPIEELIVSSLNPINIDFRDTKNPNYNFTLRGFGKGAMPGLNGQPISKTIASIMLSQSVESMVDENHMTMGNQKINKAILDNIVYDGSSVAKIWAPIDVNGDIDVNGYIQLTLILDEFAKHPEYSAAEKTLLLQQQYGIEGYIDEQGNFLGSGNSMAQFLVFTGITSDEVLDYSKGVLMDLVSNADKKTELQSIENLYRLINGSIDGGGTYEFPTGTFKTDLIKAPVFMKLKSTAQRDVLSFTKHGPLVNTPTYDNAVTLDQMRYLANQGEAVQQPSTGYVYAQ